MKCLKLTDESFASHSELIGNLNAGLVFRSHVEASANMLMAGRLVTKEYLDHRQKKNNDEYAVVRYALPSNCYSSHMLNNEEGSNLTTVRTRVVDREEGSELPTNQITSCRDKFIEVDRLAHLVSTAPIQSLQSIPLLLAGPVPLATMTSSQREKKREKGSEEVGVGNTFPSFHTLNTKPPSLYSIAPDEAQIGSTYELPYLSSVLSRRNSYQVVAKSGVLPFDNDDHLYKQTAYIDAIEYTVSLKSSLLVVNGSELEDVLLVRHRQLLGLKDNTWLFYDIPSHPSKMIKDMLQTPPMFWAFPLSFTSYFFNNDGINEHRNEADMSSPITILKHNITVATASSGLLEKQNLELNQQQTHSFASYARNVIISVESALKEGHLRPIALLLQPAECSTTSGGDSRACVWPTPLGKLVQWLLTQKVSILRINPAWLTSLHQLPSQRAASLLGIQLTTTLNDFESDWFHQRSDLVQLVAEALIIEEAPHVIGWNSIDEEEGAARQDNNPLSASAVARNDAYVLVSDPNVMFRAGKKKEPSSMTMWESYTTSNKLPSYIAYATDQSEGGVKNRQFVKTPEELIAIQGIIPIYQPPSQHTHIYSFICSDSLSKKNTFQKKKKSLKFFFV